MEFAMLSQKKQTISNNNANPTHLGGQHLNHTLLKGPRHQRGNSDGNMNLASRLHLGHHKRGSSGSNGMLKTFEESLDAGLALLS
jgi:hypothetical protein